MKRVKLVIAYDGTNYHGWQIQPEDITIESVLNRELSVFLQEEILVIGASRTDSGVHALANVCVFDTNTEIPAQRIASALNARLPQDIIIQDSCQVEDDFHPRYCDTQKTYEYTIFNARRDNPVTNRHHHFVYFPLDEKKMDQAAKIFLGFHDFRSFCGKKSSVTNFEREIYQCDVTRNGNYITMKVRGNGFLYNMVRLMAGTLVEIGRGKREVDWVKDLIDTPDKVKVGPKLPAKGLTLVSIDYI